jgi:hypothetical protein
MKIWLANKIKVIWKPLRYNIQRIWGLLINNQTIANKCPFRPWLKGYSWWTSHWSASSYASCWTGDPSVVALDVEFKFGASFESKSKLLFITLAKLSECYLWYDSLKHSLHKGMYASVPPINSRDWSVDVLKVKYADWLHYLQMAASFFTFSALGMSYKMFSNPVLRNVPSRADIMMTFPMFAAFSVNS